MGLPSDDERTSEQGQQDNDDDNFDSDNDDDDEVDTDTPSAAQRSVASSAPPVPSTPAVQFLERSQSTASLASQVSGTASFSMTAEEARRTKFDARFNTATSTNEEVLGEFHNFLNRNVYLMFCREAGGYVDLAGLPTFHNATCYHYQEGSSRLCLYMHRVRILLSEAIGLCHTNLVVSTSHPSITVSRARHDESTGNLKRHVTNCAPINSSQTNALAVYASGSKYTQANHWMKIALWIATRNRPFSIVEDPELLDIFLDLNPRCVTPKRRTVPRDVKDMFGISRKAVGTLLRVCHPHQSIYQRLSLTCTFRSIPGSYMLRQMDGPHLM
jgi:hypothetical protein